MAHVMSVPRARFFDSSGDPLSGGKLYTYAAGTSTPLATYTDQTEAVQNANPVILDSNGEAAVWVGTASYKFVLKTSADVTLWTVDAVQHIANSEIITAKLANGVLSADADGRAKMADGFLTLAKLADGILEATTDGRAKMANSFVNTAKLLDGAVTQAKRAALNEQVSSSCSNYTMASATPADVTNLSVTITTTGRPVWVGLIHDGGTQGGFVSVATAGEQPIGSLTIYRGVTIVGFIDLESRVNSSGSVFTRVKSPIGAVNTIDVPAAGTYTYKITAVSDGAGHTLSVFGAKLIAFEL